LIHILRSVDEVNMNNFKKGLHGVNEEEELPLPT